MLWALFFSAPALFAQEEPATEAGEAIFFDQVKTLVAENWQGVAEFLVQGILAMVGWLLFFLVLGIMVSVLTWWFVRKRGWLDSPWPLYRYIRWLWFFVFLFNVGFGIFMYGFWFSSNRVLKDAVVELKLVDQLAAQLFIAVLEGNPDLDVEDAESKEEVMASLEEQGDLTSLGLDKLHEMSDRLIEESKIPGLAQPLSKNIMSRLLTVENIEKLGGVKEKYLFSAALGQLGAEESTDNAADAAKVAALSAINGVLQTVEDDTLKWLDAYCRANGRIAAVMGFLIPLGLVCMLRLMVRVSTKKPTAH